MSWPNTLNIAGLPDGSFRSIAGYAGESLAIGRALLCGYNLSFKAWRDAKYDAVLDHRGRLFRVEIKQSASKDPTKLSFSTTSGARSGAQISRHAASRARVLSTEDCDFLIAVHSTTARTWVVPIEFVELLNRHSLDHRLLADFLEGWKLFETVLEPVGGVDISRGLGRLPASDLRSVANALGVDAGTQSRVRFSEMPRSKVLLDDPTDRLKVAIWRALAK